MQCTMLQRCGTSSTRQQPCEQHRSAHQPVPPLRWQSHRALRWAPICAAQHSNTCADQLQCSRREALLAALPAMAMAHLAMSDPSSALLVDEDVAESVYEKAASSTVSVMLFKKDTTGYQVQTGVGSGFVWDSYGHIVTNYHCISRLDKSSDVVQVLPVQVPGTPGAAPAGVPEPLRARILAMDTQRDLAVLQVEDEQSWPSLRPVKVGTSKDLQIGQTVLAIGAPYGLSGTMSAGLVSGLNRAIPSPVGTRIYGAIQTDASINAGNSGGPLLDSAGRVVGVNTATFTRSGTGRASGVNFAIPIDMVVEVIPSLIVFGPGARRR